jgi:hypothetical protein
MLRSVAVEGSSADSASGENLIALSCLRGRIESMLKSMTRNPAVGVLAAIYIYFTLEFLSINTGDRTAEEDSLSVGS